MKERLLPESHTDFAFAIEPIGVATGVALGVLLAAVFAFIVLRRAARSGRPCR